MTHSHTEIADSSSATEAALTVEGMDCASCVSHVQNAAESVPGVEACQVNLTRGRALVRFDPSQTTPQQIAQAIDRSGYHAHVEKAFAPNSEEERLQHQRAHARAWLRRAAIGIALWLPVESIHWLVYFITPPAHRAHGHAWMNWLAFLTSTVALFCVGSGFYRGAWAALRQRTTNMDSLIAMGATVAYVYSLIAFLGYLLHWWPTLPNLYFMEGTGLLALISLGHYLEARARDKAGSAIRDLLNLTPPTALRLVQDSGLSTQDFKEVPLADVQENDQLLVRPGDRVPVDGVVLEGLSEVDESLLTGESLPVPKKAGDEVIGGSSNQNGRLIIRATKVGAETALAQIVRLVETAQSSKPPVQQLADKVSSIFVPAVLAIAAVTGLAWYGWGHMHHWTAAHTWATIAQAVCSVLIIACPCALGLAVPATLMVGIGRGAQRGILIRDIDALQSAESIDTVVLDKTGTITQGKPAVTGIVSFNGLSQDQILRLAAAAEQYSEHPLARAIVNHAHNRSIRFPEPQSFTNEAGFGILARIEGESLLVGNTSLLQKHGYAPTSTTSPSALNPAHTNVQIARKHDHGRVELIGLIALSDPIKPDSAAAIAQLHQMKLRTVLLTGDNQATAQFIAHQVAIDDVRAQVKPDQKAQAIRDLQQVTKDNGQMASRVAMVGDGINDAPALAAADLGIAIGSGSDIAKETGGIVLLSGSLHGVAASIRLSRATMKKIRQNLFFAFIYNILAIPLAAVGLLNPLIAAAAMALSDITVLGNALLLKRTRID